MNKLVIIFGITLVSILGLATYLIINNHPWFGFFMILIGAGLKFSQTKQ